MYDKSRSALSYSLSDEPDDSMLVCTEDDGWIDAWARREYMCSSTFEQRGGGENSLRELFSGRRTHPQKAAIA